MITGTVTAGFRTMLDTYILEALASVGKLERKHFLPLVLLYQQVAPLKTCAHVQHFCLM